MKQFLLFIILLQLGLAFGQETTTVYFDGNWDNCQEGKHKYYRIIEEHENVFKVRDYYKNKTLQMSGFYEKSDSTLGLLSTDGKIDQLEIGEFKWYNKSGILYESIIYQPLKSDELQERIISDSLNLKDFETYQLTYLTTYYKNGRIEASGFMTSENVAHGKWTYFEKKTGNLWLIRSYKNGVFDGKFVYLLDNYIYKTEHYKDGQKHGETKRYLSNGVCKSTTFYENGKIIKQTTY